MKHNSIKPPWLSREQSLGKIWKKGISFRTENSHSLVLVFGALEMCVILLDRVQHHVANAARVTPAQACNKTEQKKKRFWLESRTETSPCWSTLKIVLSHFSFSFEHYWLLFVFEIALADKEQRNLYLIPVVLLFLTRREFCLKAPNSLCVRWKRTRS